MLEINLKQLESFVATVEHSGFTAAAAALYLTQSTVSAHVSALEQTLGVPLLVRGARRPVTLTPGGAECLCAGARDSEPLRAPAGPRTGRAARRCGSGPPPRRGRVCCRSC